MQDIPGLFPIFTYPNSTKTISKSFFFFSVKCLWDSYRLKQQNYGSPCKTVFSRRVLLSVQSTVNPPAFHPNYHKCSYLFMVPEVSAPGKQISAVTFCLTQIYFLDGHLLCDFISLIGSRTIVIECIVILTIVNQFRIPTIQTVLKERIKHQSCLGK